MIVLECVCVVVIVRPAVACERDAGLLYSRACVSEEHLWRKMKDPRTCIYACANVSCPAAVYAGVVAVAAATADANAASAI